MPKLSISFKPNWARWTFKLGFTRIPQLRSKESCTGDRAPGQVNMHCLSTCVLMLLRTCILNQGGRLSLTPQLLDILPHCQLMRTTTTACTRDGRRHQEGSYDVSVRLRIAAMFYNKVCMHEYKDGTVTMCRSWDQGSTCATARDWQGTVMAFWTNWNALLQPLIL